MLKKQFFGMMTLIVGVMLFFSLFGCNNGNLIGETNQTPNAADFNISGTGTFTYNGNQRLVTVTAKTGKTSGTVTVKYNGSAAAPSAVGTYTVTFDVTAATGWNAVSGLSAGTLIINAAIPNDQTPNAADFDISGTGTFIYDGNPKTVTITAQAEKTTGAVTVKYNGSATAPSAVGTYTVTFDVTAATGWNAVSGLSAGTLIINAAIPNDQTPNAADFDISGTGTFTHDGTAKTVTVTAQAEKTSGTVTVKYNGSAAAPSAVGTYTVTFDVTAATGWNAVSGLSAGTLIINAAIPNDQTPNAADFDISGTGTFIYDGTAKTVTVTAQAEKTTGAVTVKYNGSATAPSAVGTYTVTFDVTESTGWNAVSGLFAGTLIISDGGDEPTVPDAPTGVTALRNPSGSTTVTVSWNAVNGATSYRVYYSDTDNGSGTLEGSPSTTSFDSIDNNTTGTHYFRVSAVNSVGEGSPSSWVSVEPVLNIVPEKPSITNITVISSGTKGLRITWSSVTGASSYNIYSSNSQYGTYTLLATKSGSDFAHDDTTVNLNSEGASYYYQIAGVNSVGTEGSKSDGRGVILPSGVTVNFYMPARSVQSQQMDRTGKTVYSTTYQYYIGWYVIIGGTEYYNTYTRRDSAVTSQAFVISPGTYTSFQTRYIYQNVKKGGPAYPGGNGTVIETGTSTRTSYVNRPTLTLELLSKYTINAYTGDVTKTAVTLVMK